MTSEISTYFEKLFKEIEHVSFNDTIRDLEKKVEKLTKQISEYQYGGVPTAPGGSRSKSIPLQRNKSTASNLNDKPMTLQEKKILGQNIRSLPAEYLRGVWEIVAEGMPVSNSREELEFDIDALPPRTCRELEKYVKGKIALINKNLTKKKSEPAFPRPSMSDYAEWRSPEIPTDITPALPTYGAGYHDDDDGKSSESSFISDS